MLGQRSFILLFVGLVVSEFLIVDVSGTPSGRTVYKNGKTALHNAAQNGDVKEAEKLIAENSSLVNSRDNSNETPLHEAAFHGRKNIAELLIRAGAFVNSVDNALLTPLHIAAFKGHKNFAELLLNNSANYKMKNQWGETPLEIATKRGQTDIAKLLKGKGAVE
ncbi:ankyrin repeat, PH and SEC7 domain containing protein secG-like isoform X2 [Sitodiplosis mosellana]|uniref:ankyrin repeat, PH and SEC7 domain containing protein secG-like isoform X2 n=1 Tax=Sitodiplosis mosellana TaxID=263140 RepID=UPI0024447DFD|nr:ankyrin repeat, PH and SEC7 domain containing protein secG-like isoform X2 [Sitodiplosis mosellana]